MLPKKKLVKSGPTGTYVKEGEECDQRIWPGRCCLKLLKTSCEELLKQ